MKLFRVLLLIGLSSCLVEAGPITESDFKNACQAASSPVNYGEFASVLPNSFTESAKTYRQAWEAFCKTQGKNPDLFYPISALFLELKMRC
jgi:hypothetical protein